MSVDDLPSWAATMASDVGWSRSDAVPAPIEAAAARALSDELPAGFDIGDYVVESLVGVGGMGLVYAARHRVIGKRVAIKVLRSELCANARSVVRFLGEAKAVNRIGHRNIVDVATIGELPDGRHYLVMEMLSGSSLGARMKAGTIPLPEMCRILVDVCHALEAAHAKNVIHRDLKPDNVFLHEGGEAGADLTVKLLDFGIAKLQGDSEDTPHTSTGAVMGTPKYLAPEQARGLAVSPASDVYSLGVVAYEALAGRAPFIGDTPVDVVLKHVIEAPTPPSAWRPLPPALDRLITRMLAKDPAQRPTLPEVRAGLAAAAKVGPDQWAMAHDPAPARPRRGWWIGAGVAVAALGVVALMAWGPAPTPTPGPAAAPPPATTAPAPATTGPVTPTGPGAPSGDGVALTLTAPAAAAAPVEPALVAGPSAPSVSSTGGRGKGGRGKGAATTRAGKRPTAVPTPPSTGKATSGDDELMRPVRRSGR